MSLWNSLIQHSGFERIRPLYNKQFPLEVRFVCAAWIENRMKEESFVDIDDPQIELNASQFLHALIQEVQNEKQKLNRVEQLSIKCRLDESIQTFTQQLYCPFVIYKHIRDTISYEQNLIENVCGGQQTIDPEAADINNKLKELTTQMQINKGKQTEYRHEVENCKLLNCSDKIRQKQRFLVDRATNLYQSFESTIDKIDAVQVVIVNRLGKWKRDQALAGNGAPLNGDTLDEIQRWFEALGKVILNTRLCIDATHELNVGLPMAMNMEDVMRKITALLQNLIVSGFIVEKQPPQVMKRNVRFSATVRLLTADFHKSNPSVVVSILSESMCQARQQHHLKPSDETSGEIINNTGNLEMQQSTQRLSCNLGNMQLKNIKRSEKVGTESVTDETFVLLFKSTFQMAGIQINVWVKSIPIVVIVHSNQEPQSWATITWQNAFSEFSRVPSQMVDKVNWSHLANALNMKFTCQTGRGLTAESLYYLCEKAFRTTINFDPNDQPISWSQFCKDPLPELAFTFWDWFYAVTKLTRDYLRGPWIDGSIIGFVNRRETEKKLLQCPPGTFLLRFADSQLGGISISWVENAANPRVVSLQPFSWKDFTIRSLADCIKDLDQCVTLYPDIPKDNAFGKYYSDAGETANGYVKSILKMTVPDDTHRMLNHPNTPQHSRRQSPVHTKDTELRQCYQGLTKSTNAWMN